MKRCIALVVGNNEYENATNLDGAVYDAESIAKGLNKLQYAVDVYTNCEIFDFQSKISSFIDKIKSGDYDVALFYFAGHGIEINGSNCLLAKNTPMENELGTKKFSINLQDVVKDVYESGAKMNIFIIDACRNNPYTSRAIGTVRLAPILAPKGTLIAYSTSPGEMAKDSGIGSNSIYTGSLLQHIFRENLEIEEFFKEVRTSVFTLSGGRQTSWEHTSLIGHYQFNEGQLVHSITIPYKETAISDDGYESANETIVSVLNDFKSYNYYKQGPAITKFKQIQIDTIDANDLFVIGRNVLQAAEGGCWDCIEFMKDERILSSYSKNNSNHLLNGVLFEIYFNSKGKYRKGDIKGTYLNDVIKLIKFEKLKFSFEFINKVLIESEQNLFFLPSVSPNKVTFNVLLNKEIYNDMWPSNEEYYCIKSIMIGTIELLTKEPNIYTCNLSNLTKFKEQLSVKYFIPIDYIVLITNITVLENIDFRLPYLLEDNN